MRALLFIAALLASACGGSPGTRARLVSAPASQVQVVETPRGNHEVRVTLTRVPPPQRYDPTGSVFVVWIVPPEGVPIRAGEVEYDPRSGDGSASVLTPPYERFHVMVTAEPSHVERDAPGPAVVFAEEVLV